MAQPCTNENQNPKSFTKSHKAVFLYYQFILEKYGEMSPQLSQDFKYGQVARLTYKQPVTVGIILRKMIRNGYQVDERDEDIIEIREVMKERKRNGQIA